MEIQNWADGGRRRERMVEVGRPMQRGSEEEGKGVRGVDGAMLR